LLFEFLDEGYGLLRADVEAVVFYDAITADDDGPWGASGFEVFHDLRAFLGAAALADGEMGELVFLGDFLGSLWGVRAESFKDSLNGEAFDRGVEFEFVADFLKGGEARFVATGAPGLKAVEVDDFSFERFRGGGFGAFGEGDPLVGGDGGGFFTEDAAFGAGERFFGGGVEEEGAEK